MGMSFNWCRLCKTAALLLDVPKFHHSALCMEAEGTRCGGGSCQIAYCSGCFMVLCSSAIVTHMQWKVPYRHSRLPRSLWISEPPKQCYQFCNFFGKTFSPPHGDFFCCCQKWWAKKSSDFPGLLETLETSVSIRFHCPIVPCRECLQTSGRWFQPQAACSKRQVQQVAHAEPTQILSWWINFWFNSIQFNFICKALSHIDRHFIVLEQTNVKKEKN